METDSPTTPMCHDSRHTPDGWKPEHPEWAEVVAKVGAHLMEVETA